MKATILAGAFVFVMLFIATTFLESPQAVAEARSYGFTDEQIDQGLQYAFGRRLLFWSETALQLTVLVLAVFCGWGVTLRNFCLRCSAGFWLPSVILVGLICFLVSQVIEFPFAYGRLEYARHWGMTDRSTVDWLIDYGKTMAVILVIGGVPFIGFYLLVRWLPRWWWLPAGVGVILLSFVVVVLMPVVIAPLFNTFTPLSQTRWSHLEKTVRTLAKRADVPLDEVYVVDASRQGKHTNAYFTGFGATQQIVLYDTLLKEHKDVDEVESVLAHEIGHWQHNHIVKGVLLTGAATLVGLFLLSRLLLYAVQRRPFNLTRPADPASWPLVLLAAFLANWATAPLGNAVSRAFEREADYTALELAGKPKAFIEAEMRLARSNISNVAPTRFGVWVFATHPPVIERIRMAEEWGKAKGK